MTEPPEHLGSSSDSPHNAHRVEARFFDVARLASQPFIYYIPLLVLFFLLGSLFWAKNQDPFSRRWFSLKGLDNISFDCVAVLPKPVRQCPVIVYAHGAGGSLMNDGTDLRQMAELGLAVVSLQYDQSDDSAFDLQWPALLNYLARQPWADTNAIAWVGFSLGANKTLAYMREHPDKAPRLLVHMSGTGLHEGEVGSYLKLACPVLLVHGEQDELFPAVDTRRFAAQLQTNHQAMTLQIIPGAPHDLGAERAEVFRGVGEYCLTRLSGPDAWQRYHSIAQWQAKAPPFWLFCLPAVVAAGLLAGRKKLARLRGKPANSNPITTGAHPCAAPERGSASRSTPIARGMPKLIPRLILLVTRCGSQILPSPLAMARQARAPVRTSSKGEFALRGLAVVLATCAVVETALHLAPPHFAVSPTSLSLARRFLVQPSERADFEWLAAKPIWPGVKLKVLLEHAQLAGYNRTLVNWQLEDKLFRDDVLSPVITGSAGEKLNWRRALWEEFYPRIRHETDLTVATSIIIRHLRERVTMAKQPHLPQQVPEIWVRQITDETGFAIIEVAALRSAGLPARLVKGGQAEMWNGSGWQAVPAPVVGVWQQPKI